MAFSGKKSAADFQETVRIFGKTLGSKAGAFDERTPNMVFPADFLNTF